MSLNIIRIARIGALAIGLFGTAFVSRSAPPTLPLISNDRRHDERIVGVWRVKLISEGSVGIPDGTLFDDSYAQWHADGTEVTISIFAPATGNICFGVWQKMGPSTYTLNHFGLGFDASGTFTGQAQVREHVVVDRKGNRFEGVFSVDSYDPQGHLVARIVGRVIGTRVTVRTTIQQVL